MNRRRNYILSLKINDSVVLDPQVIGDKAVSWFRNLFSKDGWGSLYFSENIHFNNISNSAAERLEDPFSEEVFTTIKGLS
ncbi:hypothetical protein RYX45_21685, partial [Alkalihalophilus pseudofirmus]|nr:hypothetical protein [Alkalihalophilus pseudofirmus]